MKRIMLVPAVALLGACATVQLANLQPQVETVNSGPKIPMKVALVVPASTRALNQALILPSGCFGLSYAPGPLGDIFANTMEQVLDQFFSQVVVADTAPKDVDLVLEATMSSIGTKTACLADPQFFSEARGTFRAMDPRGQEVWRSTRVSGRAEQPLPMSNITGTYQQIVGKAMAQLASNWALDLAMSQPVRARAGGGERRSRRGSDEDSGSGDEKGGAWWKQQ